MTALDPRSIIVIAGILGLLMGVVMGFLRRNYPSSIGGLADWSAAPIVCFFAAMLLGQRGVLPDVLTVLVGNIALAIGCLFFYFGTTRFYKVEPRRKLWIGMALAMALPLGWFTYVTPNFGARIFLVNAFIAVVFAAHVVFLIRHGSAQFSRYFCIVVLLLQTAVLAARSIAALSQMGGGGILDRTVMQTWYTAGFTVCLVMLCVGTILMASEGLHAELERLATRDSLTGVLNRGAILRACQDELARCKRGGQAMSLMMLDLDFFKKINDGYGHLMGDKVLVDFVSRTGTILRPHDRLGRYGGEEFVILLPDTALENALRVAQRIHAGLPCQTGLPRCTVSIGITASRGMDDSLDTMLVRADEALYWAKDHGRNQSHTQL